MGAGFKTHCEHGVSVLKGCALCHPCQHPVPCKRVRYREEPYCWQHLSGKRKRELSEKD